MKPRARAETLAVGEAGPLIVALETGGVPPAGVGGGAAGVELGDGPELFAVRGGGVGVGGASDDGGGVVARDGGAGVGAGAAGA